MPTNKEDSAAGDGRALGAVVTLVNSSESMAAPASRKPLVHVFRGHYLVRVFRGRYVEAETAKIMRGWLRDLSRDARAKQGVRAFLKTQRCIALHEAGHIVVVLAERGTVSWASIERTRHVGRKTWIGITYYCGISHFTSAESSVASDWSKARITLAGLVAEWLFDRENFREGSSIDEVCEALVYAGNIALKSGKPLEAVWFHMFAQVVTTLKRNSAIVERLAAALARRGCISRAKIEKIVRRRR